MSDQSQRTASPSDLDYSSFVGLVRERNRPSGGVRTVQEVAVQARLGSRSNVLEIGSNTGFTSVNLALLCGATVLGIDLNADSVAAATADAAVHGVSDRVTFRLDDARGLGLQDGDYDAVWVSNVVSFVSEKSAMLRETVRVLRVGGTLVAVPIYYRTTPPASVVEQVSEAIGTQVDVMSKRDWMEFFESSGDLELYHQTDYEYDLRSADDIDAYCDLLMDKPHLAAMGSTERDEIRERMGYFMTLFNDNLSYAGFSVLLFQKRVARDEVELFTSRAVVPGAADDRWTGQTP